MDKYESPTAIEFNTSNQKLGMGVVGATLLAGALVVLLGVTYTIVGNTLIGANALLVYNHTGVWTKSKK